MRLSSHWWVLPACTQWSVRQWGRGKWWDKWLFMICHLPTSAFPGPHSLQLQADSAWEKTRAHVHTRACAKQLLLTCIYWHCAQQPPSIFAHISFFHLKVTYLRGSLLSCHIHHDTDAESVDATKQSFQLINRFKKPDPLTFFSCTEK